MPAASSSAPLGASSAGHNSSYGHCRSVTHRQDHDTAKQLGEDTSELETKFAREQQEHDPTTDPITKVLQATGAQTLLSKKLVQSLWSQYGNLWKVKLGLKADKTTNLVVKHVQWPKTNQHPRGFANSISHQRKVKSYQVETHFYENFSQRCTQKCRVPSLVKASATADGVLLIMEDLDSAGFPHRLGHVSRGQLTACLSWLAHFHAVFLNQAPVGLWTTGTYWHLATRPDELEEIRGTTIADFAPTIDATLNGAQFQTFVHGDAKIANFCFGADENSVSAVDFQYVGGGCGIKDVAYFLSSCFDEDELEQSESDFLDLYFDPLRSSVMALHPEVDVDALIAEWRSLYCVAWADFYRFLCGWSPGHWKCHGYTRRCYDRAKALLKT